MLNFMSYISWSYLWCFPCAVPVRLVWAAETKDVELPCDITSPVAGDSAKLVLWFKDTTGIPLYRYILLYSAFSLFSLWCRLYWKKRIPLYTFLILGQAFKKKYPSTLQYGFNLDLFVAFNLSIFFGSPFFHSAWIRGVAVPSSRRRTLRWQAIWASGSIFPPMTTTQKMLVCKYATYKNRTEASIDVASISSTRPPEMFALICLLSVCIYI